MKNWISDFKGTQRPIAPPRQGDDRRRAFRRWEKRGTVILQLGGAVSALLAVLRSRSWREQVPSRKLRLTVY